MDKGAIGTMVFVDLSELASSLTLWPLVLY